MILYWRNTIKTSNEELFHKDLEELQITSENILKYHKQNRKPAINKHNLGSPNKNLEIDQSSQLDKYTIYSTSRSVLTFNVHFRTVKTV